MRSSGLPRAMGVAGSGTRVANRRGRGSLPSVDLHAISLPAGTFTGDFYLAERGAEGLWIALGDIAGKGLPAAVVMAMVQEGLEQRLAECVMLHCDPVGALQRLQDLLLPLLPSNRFVTAVIAHLREDGTLVIANAGHCAPLIARVDGTIEPIAPTGPVVGILDNPRWSSVKTNLARGETLLLYTDGVTEARSGDDEEFGLAQVAATLSAASATGVSARQVTGAILMGVERHARGAREDDLTLVAIRRTQRPAGRMHAV